MSWSANNHASAEFKPAITSMEVPAGLSTVSPPNSTSDASNDGQSQDERQPSIASTAATDQNKDRITVPSACIQCRNKHLKCDGLIICTRCSSNGFECLYVKSRRGYKGPRKNTVKNPESNTLVSAAVQPTVRACPLVRPSTARPVSNNVPSGLATPPVQMPLAAIGASPYDINRELVAYDSKNLPSGLDIRERCIEAFYFHFYPAHVSFHFKFCLEPNVIKFNFSSCYFKHVFNHIYSLIYNHLPCWPILTLLITDSHLSFQDHILKLFAMKIRRNTLRQ